jgi:hypothetical protein
MPTKTTFSVTPDAPRSGSSLQTEVIVSYAELVAAFGEPSEADGYKVSSEWTFTSERGEVVSLYDYKETALYDASLPSVESFRARPSYSWHVGAKDREAARRFILWLQTSDVLRHS